MHNKKAHNKTARRLINGN